jgi:hypothetical protein
MGSTANPYVINFSKKVAIWGTFMNGVNQTPDFRGTSNNFARCNIGGRSAFSTGNITSKGIGWFLQGGGAAQVNLTVHDGTTRTDVLSGFTPGTQTCFHYMVFSDGAGNVYLYINGTLRCQTALGPVGETISSRIVYEEQVEGGAVSTNYAVVFGGAFTYLEP